MSKHFQSEEEYWEFIEKHNIKEGDHYRIATSRKTMVVKRNEKQINYPRLPENILILVSHDNHYSWTISPDMVILERLPPIRSSHGGEEKEPT